MRTSTLFHLLVVAVLFAAGCDDSSQSLEPAAEPTPGPLADVASLSTPPRWADGYLLAGSPTAASYAPLPVLSYNRSGGAMRITKTAGTTGRYLVTFTGLSAVIGNRNTVHVTEYGLDDTYCKPVSGRLASDQVEVRCFRASTRTPANAAFTVLVTGARAKRIFAYANQPTAADYAPAANGSYNPNGAIRVGRLGVGVYKVSFRDFAKAVPSGNAAGSTQAGAVGTGKAHCTIEDWGNGATADFNVYVECFTPAGVPSDSKFTVLFVLPDDHMAYTLADSPSASSYSPSPTLTWNPSGGGATITRNGTGDYTVIWSGVDPAIVETGTVHVTAGADNGSQCKATSLFDVGAMVHCFGPNGAARDMPYSVMIGS